MRPKVEDVSKASYMMQDFQSPPTITVLNEEREVGIALIFPSTTDIFTRGCCQRKITMSQLIKKKKKKDNWEHNFLCFLWYFNIERELRKERNNLLWTVDELGIPNRADLGLGKYHIDNTFFISAALPPFLFSLSAISSIFVHLASMEEFVWI